MMHVLLKKFFTVLTGEIKAYLSVVFTELRN
jgi:hypothetical protein